MTTAAPQILIMVTGMGDPQTGDTTQWATALYPTADVTDGANGRRWLDVNGGRIYLVEVEYDDVNAAVLAKYTGLTDLIPGTVPPSACTFIENFIDDVVTQVLVPEAVDAAQLRFVDKYATAIQIALDEVGDGGNIGNATVGVLCHSLGTLVGYEGIYRSFDAPQFLKFPKTRLVLCAPMLSPIYDVQKRLGLHRYLTDHGSAKPYKPYPGGGQYTMLDYCMAIYNDGDPFRLISKMAFYDRAKPGNDLVDDYATFDSESGVQAWNGHSMIDKYIKHNRDRITKALFG